MPKNQWSNIIENIGIIGKYLVNIDKENIGNFSNIRNWHIGSILWGLSEHLSLLNIFIPKKRKTDDIMQIKQHQLINQQREEQLKKRRRFTVIS